MKSKSEKKYNELVKELVISADSFVINRPLFGTHSILAGYPWFLDWGRDTLIAFEGLLLITKRFDLAKEILLTFTRDIKFGLVPNGYSGYDNRPLYNSVDASLLLFEQVYKDENFKIRTIFGVETIQTSLSLNEKENKKTISYDVNLFGKIKVKEINVDILNAIFSRCSLVILANSLILFLIYCEISSFVLLLFNIEENIIGLSIATVFFFLFKYNCC